MSISKKVLFTILTLFFVIFFLFMSLTIYGNILADEDFINEHALSEIKDSISGALNAKDPNDNISSAVGEINISGRLTACKPECVAVISNHGDNSVANSVSAWCVLYKYRCKIFDYWPDATELNGYDIIVSDDIPLSADDVKKLDGICEAGIDVIITRISSMKALNDSAALRNILGIKEIVADEYEIDGVHLYGGFYLSSDRLYHDDDDYGENDDMRLKIPYFTLRAGYEVYATALLDDQEELGILNEEMPPLLWRTATGDANVFVINSNVFSGEALNGTLTAFISRASQTFVYPVANAQMNCIFNYPWLLAENNDELARIYGHRAYTLSSSVLWPNMVQTIYNYHQTADFYVSAQTNYDAAADNENEMAEYAIKQIRKLLGTMGLSLKQTSKQPLESVLERNSEFFKQKVPSWRFTSVYCGDFRPSELEPYLADRDGFLGNVSTVLYDRKDGDPLISSLNDNVLLLGLTSYGFRHEALDDIILMSNETALALDMQYIDMDRVLYPEKDDDYWNKLSIDWASAVTYYNDFKQFDFVLADEMESRIRGLLSCDYNYAEAGDVLTIKSAGIKSGESAYFIIRMFGKVPDTVSGGKLTKLSDTSYLLEVQADEVVITERPSFGIDMP